MKMNYITPQPIKVELIDRHPWNRLITAASVAELKPSIARNGIETALQVRQKPDGRYELIKGERRLTCARELGMDEVPCQVAEKDDTEAYLSLLRDNLQRENLSPVQEAHSYHRLLSLKDETGAAFTADSIAASLSRQVDTVYRRLKLVNLPDACANLLESGELGEWVAYMIAKLPKGKIQDAFAARMTRPYDEYNGDAWPTKKQAQKILNTEVLVSLAKAPFDLKDATLTPDLGACIGCPWLASNNPDFASEVQTSVKGAGGGRAGTQGGLSGLTCTNPAHYQLKLKAHSERLIATAKEEHMPVLRGKEAEALVSQHGGLAHGSAVMLVSEKLGYDELGHFDTAKAPTAAVIIEKAKAQGMDAPVKLLVHPKTGLAEKVIDRKALVALGKLVDPKTFVKGGEKSSAAADYERKEKERKELLGLEALEALDQAREVLNKQGIGLDDQFEVVRLALKKAGNDGGKLVAKWLEVPKADKQSEHDLAGHVVAYLRGSGATKAQLETLVVLILLADGLRWAGADYKDFAPWAECLGLSAAEIKSKARREQSDAKAAKKKKSEKGKVKSEKGQADGLGKTLQTNDDMGFAVQAKAAGKPAKVKKQKTLKEPVLKVLLAVGAQQSILNRPPNRLEVQTWAGVAADHVLIALGQLEKSGFVDVINDSGASLRDGAYSVTLTGQLVIDASAKQTEIVFSGEPQAIDAAEVDEYPVELQVDIPEPEKSAFSAHVDAMVAEAVKGAAIIGDVYVRGDKEVEDLRKKWKALRSKPDQKKDAAGYAAWNAERSRLKRAAERLKIALPAKKKGEPSL